MEPECSLLYSIETATSHSEPEEFGPRPIFSRTILILSSIYA